jgi:hypothetical protein
MIFEQVFEHIYANTWGGIWAAQHGFNNMQGCRHEVTNTRKGVEQQDYYLQLIKKQKKN